MSHSPDLPDLSRTLTYRLHRLHKLTDLESQRRYPEVTGLSLSDGRCLTAVGQFEPLSVNQLAQRANLNKGQASRAAQYLVEQGLVRKQGWPDDRRGVELTLSPEGRRVWRKAMALVAERNQEIFGCLRPAEQVTLSDLLDRLLEHAEHSLRGDDDNANAGSSEDRPPQPVRTTP